MENYINTTEMAKLLRLSVRRVNQLVKENILKKEIDGKFNIYESLDSYYSYKFKSNEELNYEIEHTLLEKAKREKAEIELEQLKGSLLYAIEVEELMANMILTCKSRLLSIPTKCAAKIIGKTDISLITNVIKNEVYDALNELSQIPAEKLGEESK
jgi:phage terminase Nu1 subunit (DNA packaging protein)